MNAWLWLLWGLGVLALVTGALVIVAAVIEYRKQNRTCPSCGQGPDDWPVQRLTARDMN